MRKHKVKNEEAKIFIISLSWQLTFAWYLIFLGGARQNSPVCVI